MALKKCKAATHALRAVFYFVVELILWGITVHEMLQAEKPFQRLILGRLAPPPPPPTVEEQAAGAGESDIPPGEWLDRTGTELRLLSCERFYGPVQMYVLHDLDSYLSLFPMYAPPPEPPPSNVTLIAAKGRESVLSPEELHPSPQEQQPEVLMLQKLRLCETATPPPRPPNPNNSRVMQDVTVDSSLTMADWKPVYEEEQQRFLLRVECAILRENCESYGRVQNYMSLLFWQPGALEVSNDLYRRAEVFKYLVAFWWVVHIGELVANLAAINFYFRELELTLLADVFGGQACLYLQTLVVLHFVSAHETYLLATYVPVVSYIILFTWSVGSSLISVGLYFAGSRGPAMGWCAVNGAAIFGTLTIPMYAASLYNWDFLYQAGDNGGTMHFGVDWEKEQRLQVLRRIGLMTSCLMWFKFFSGLAFSLITACTREKPKAFSGSTDAAKLHAPQKVGP